MENLDLAYINFENKRAYFCSLDIEWLTFFDDCIIETINELEVFNGNFEIKKDSTVLHESILNQQFAFFSKKVELEHQKDIVCFDFKFSNGIEINFRTGEVSMSFPNSEKLKDTCYAILLKANYSVEETFQKLVEENYYCLIAQPNEVHSTKPSPTDEEINFFDAFNF